jgi:hypothetical protein
MTGGGRAGDGDGVFAEIVSRAGRKAKEKRSAGSQCERK